MSDGANIDHKTAFFDCQFGAAGDMLLGGLIGAGLSVGEWQNELKKVALPQDSFDITIENTVRCTIASKKVTVRTESGHEHRQLRTILDIIERSDIGSKAKSMAATIFENLGRAESKVHGVSIDEVHFHEVGAIDAMIDIIGFSIAYDLLKIEKSIVSPLPLGNGTINTAHGIFPVPAPAVPIMLAAAGAKILSAEINHECLTPTGAAILTTIADQWSAIPKMDKLIGIGYGAGDRNPQNYPNICRVYLGEVVSGNEYDRFKNSSRQILPCIDEIICVLEANIDDMAPQTLAYAMERLLEAGALDVSVIPAVMKKGRSGHLLTVICRTDDKSAMQEIIIRQTTTLGVRSHLCERLAANREWREIKIDDNGGTVRVKISVDNKGNILNAQPEYEDCARYAIKTGRPLKDVLIDVLAKFRLENARS